MVDWRRLVGGKVGKVAIGVLGIVGVCFLSYYLISRRLGEKGEELKRGRIEETVGREKPVGEGRLEERVESPIRQGIEEETDYQSFVYGRGQGRVKFEVRESALRLVEDYVYLRILGGSGDYSKDETARLFYALDGNNDGRIEEGEVRDYVIGLKGLLRREYDFGLPKEEARREPARETGKAEPRPEGAEEGGSGQGESGGAVKEGGTGSI